MIIISVEKDGQTMNMAMNGEVAGSWVCRFRKVQVKWASIWQAVPSDWSLDEVRIASKKR
jgi:hypothetical protein